jgi:hypothetical protein
LPGCRGLRFRDSRQLNLATQQTIYQALVPVAYPVLYDLGTGINHAKHWICRSDVLILHEKNLFQKTGARCRRRAGPGAASAPAGPFNVMR